MDQSLKPKVNARNAQSEMIVLLGEEEKVKGKWVNETREHPNVHDSYGNIHTLKSVWNYQILDNIQKCLRRVLLGDTEIRFHKIKSIPDKVLRDQIRRTVRYGIGTIVHEEITK